MILRRTQARTLIRTRLGTDQLPPYARATHLGLRDRQGRESAVNPLFLEETLQMLLTLNVVAQDQNNRYGDGRLRIDEARLSQMQVSDTIYTLLLSRLDQLPAAERGLLQYASVIGREFDLATLVGISPSLTRETAVQLLETLVPSRFGAAAHSWAWCQRTCIPTQSHPSGRLPKPFLRTPPIIARNHC